MLALSVQRKGLSNIIASISLRRTNSSLVKSFNKQNIQFFSFASNNLQRPTGRFRSNYKGDFSRSWDGFGGSTDHQIKNEVAARDKFKVFIFNNSGDFTSCSFPRQETHKMIPGVPLRDLHRTVWNSQRQISSIVVREDCLVVKLEHLKGIIQDRSFILFDADNPAVKAFAMNELSDALAINNFSATPRPPSPIPLPKEQKPLNANQSPENKPLDSFESQPADPHWLEGTDHKYFEFSVLDAMLTSITTDFEHRLNLLLPVVHKAIDYVSSIVNEEALTRLTVMKNSLTTFEYGVKEFRSALNDLLQSDDDLSNMYLTRKVTRKRNHEVLKPREDHTEIEFMLENYFKRSEEILNEILKMKDNISTAMALIQTTQEVTLNNTLQLNVKISMLSVGVATGSLISGMFGMNLVNHFENSPIAFACVSSSIAGIVVGSYVGIWTIYRRKQRLLKRQSQRAASNAFFENINSVDYVSQMYNSIGNKQFMQAVEEGIGMKLRPDETTQFFAEYDLNKNGTFEKTEFDKAISSIKVKKNDKMKYTSFLESKE